MRRLLRHNVVLHWKNCLKVNSEGTMGKLKVTQVKSSIKRPKNQKLTLEALGLTRIGVSVEHDATPSIVGMINKVKHLISVEEVK